jgi:hypothetical protein
VIEYIGEIITEFTMQCRKLKYQSDNLNFVMRISPKFYVDATEKGNISRYLFKLMRDLLTIHVTPIVESKFTKVFYLEY